MRPGPFFSVSDPSVAFDARDGAWIISWLGAHFSGGGVVDVMASRSTDGNLTWSTPQVLSNPMQLGWLAPTTQGVMVGDYISTSFLAGQQRVVGAFAVGFPPSSDGSLNEPMFAGTEKIRTGVSHSKNNSVQFNGAAENPSTTF
jgi:hypothetical protein